MSEGHDDDDDEEEEEEENMWVYIYTKECCTLLVLVPRPPLPSVFYRISI